MAFINTVGNGLEVVCPVMAVTVVLADPAFNEASRVTHADVAARRFSFLRFVLRSQFCIATDLVCQDLVPPALCESLGAKVLAGSCVLLRLLTHFNRLFILQLLRLRFEIMAHLLQFPSLLLILNSLEVSSFGFIVETVCSSPQIPAVLWRSLLCFKRYVVVDEFL